MATVHVAFGDVGVRSHTGELQIPRVDSKSPRIAENVSTSGTTAYTNAAAQGRGEVVAVTVPTGASVWIAADEGQAGTLDVAATNAWRQDGPSTRFYWLDGGDGLAIEDVA